MLNIFYTDYTEDGSPLPNGYDPNETRTDVWKTGDLHMMLECANQPFMFTTKSNKPFIFPIHFRLKYHFTARNLSDDGSSSYSSGIKGEMFKPLSEIIPTYLVSDINSHGYILITDDEGYTTGPWVIYEQCKSMGIDPNRVIYLSRNMQLIKHYDKSFYYNENWNQYYWNLKQDSFRTELAEIMREPHVHRVTALSGRADPHKIFMLNELHRQGLAESSNISFRLPLKDRGDTEYLTNLIDSDLLDQLPIEPIVKYDSEGVPEYRYSEATGLLQTVLQFRQSKIAIWNASPMGRYGRSKPYKWGVLNLGFVPIVLSQRPFLVNGEYPLLPYIREHGFKTFEGIIDESYDAIDDCELKAKAIAKETTRLTDKDLEECKSITTHNLKHFFSLTYNRDTTDHILRLLNA